MKKKNVFAQEKKTSSVDAIKVSAKEDGNVKKERENAGKNVASFPAAIYVRPSNIATA